MEDYIIKKEYDSDEEKIIPEFKEYIINYENNDYILRIEGKEKDIYFILSINNNIVYNYKLNMNLLDITNKLELNSNKYSSLESILNLFDEIYKNNNISLDLTNDNYCILSIIFMNVKEVKYQLKLYKHYTNTKDKYDILAYQIRLLKNNNNLNNNNGINNNDKLEQMNNTINELSNKIKEQENKIKNLENKNDELINNKDINLNINELFNKFESKIKTINDKLLS